MPPQPLRAFLEAARSALKAPASKRPVPLTFVVGNEAADLDSLCSALVVAYLRSHTPPNTLHIPLCHIPRDDLKLRPEFTALLERAAAGPDDVVTLDELPDPGTLSAGDTQWFLVDHNSMTGTLGQLYGKRIIGCIDHHDEEGKVPRDADVRLIEKSGSCMSLVVRHFRRDWDALLSASEADTQLAHLALGPILIDTANLGDENKTTSIDEDAARYVEAKLSSSSCQPGGAFDRGKFYQEIAHLKEGISKLPMRDVLRKDYKEWTESGLKLGTSSAPQDFDFLVEHARKGGEDLLEEIDRWGKEKELDLVAILTAFKKGDSFSRELLVWARTTRAVEVAKRFESRCGKELELGSWGCGRLNGEPGENQWRRFWTQGRVEKSRKQIAPLLRDAMKSKGEN